jgi:hypothetical protein
MYVRPVTNRPGWLMCAQDAYKFWSLKADSLQPWLRWGNWAQNAIALNEFLDERWAIVSKSFQQHSWSHVHKPVVNSYQPDHDGRSWWQEFYYANANTVGEAILKIRGMLTEWHWYWICVGILFGFSLVFNILTIFALEFMNCTYIELSKHHNCWNIYIKKNHPDC